MTMNDTDDETMEIEERLEEQPQGGALKRRKSHMDSFGERTFGVFFNGFQKTAVLKNVIPIFKDYYYATRMEGFTGEVMEICKRFNEEKMYPDFKVFFPFPAQLTLWAKKWDYDIATKVSHGVQVVDSKNRILPKIVQTRDEFNQLIEKSDLAPSDVSLEAATRSLAGELLNDAFGMLRQDQDLEEVYDDEVLVKRRNYVLNVVSKVSGMVQGKAALMLKGSEEKRNNANFMMNLLAKASAGTLTQEELDILSSTHPIQESNATQTN